MTVSRCLEQQQGSAQMIYDAMMLDGRARVSRRVCVARRSGSRGDRGFRFVRAVPETMPTCQALSFTR